MLAHDRRRDVSPYKTPRDASRQAQRRGGFCKSLNQLLERIDIPSQQVAIETKFMELTDSASTQLGIRWDSLAEFGVRLQAGPFAWNRSAADSRELTDTARRYSRSDRSDSTVQYYDLDGRPSEDVSDIRFVENPNTGEFIPLREFTPTRTVESSTASGTSSEREVLRTFARSIEDNQAAILEVDSFDVVLSALKRTEGVSVISNPKIIVANGSTDAFFSAGSREPIIKTQITRGTADSPGDKLTAELDTEINTEYIKEGYLETGIDLRVIPVVKSDGLIEAEITPSVKRKTGDKIVGDNSWPIISVKEIRTRFTLRSGQTVAIGGLTDTSDDVRTSKVPLLGDIPLIGKYLFSHSQDVTAKKETIIFVTLALADPHDLYKQTGIPGDSELVHRRLLQEQVRRREFEERMERNREDADRERADQTHRTRSRLLRRR